MNRSRGPKGDRVVFISHSSRDRDAAVVMRGAMHDVGLATWLAPDDIPPSSDWAAAIVDALISAHGLVVLLSSESLRSRQVAREVAMAVERGITIVPIRLAHVRISGSLQYLLQLVQWIDAFPDLPARARSVAREVRVAIEASPDHRSRLPSGMPADLNQFIGRAAELEQLEDAFADARLVVITGPAGVGKTRLAREVARRLADRGRDGALFVDLGALTSNEAVLATVAAAAGIEAGADALAALSGAWRQSDMLLILDNVEQIARASQPIRQLLDAAPSVQLLVTSRRPVRVTGERILRLAPMAVRAGDAARLFLQRAEDVGADTSTFPADVVSEICARVDGLPLGIELAAAQTRSISPAEIAAQLRHSLTLRNPMEDAPDRHRSLDAAIAWSESLLDEAERELFGQLSIFTESFDLSAVREVCQVDNPEGYGALEPLTGLIDQSLVAPVPNEDRPRFHMLETIRAFASDSLNHSLDEDALRAIGHRHFQYYAKLVDVAFHGLVGPDHTSWMRRLADDEANIRVGLERAASLDELGSAIRTAARMRRYWVASGQLFDAKAALLALLDACATDEATAADDEAVAEGLTALGAVHVLLTELQEARDVLERALRHWRRLGDIAGESRALTNLAAAHRYPGGMGTMEKLLQEAIRLSHEVGDRWGVAASMGNLAVAYAEGGEFSKAADQYKLVAAEFEALGDGPSVAMATLGVGSALLRQGKLDAARPHLEKATEMYAELQDADGAASAAMWRGQLMSWSGEAAEAIPVLEAATRASAASGDLYGSVEGLERLADAASRSGMLDVAALLLGSAASARDAHDWPLEAVEAGWQSDLLARLSDGLGITSRDRLMLIGRQVEIERLVDPEMGDEIVARAGAVLRSEAT